LKHFFGDSSYKRALDLPHWSSYGERVLKAMVFPVYGPAHVLELKEIEKPSPRDDGILIKIHAAVVTRTDCETRNGEPLFA
jgi:D-arabinose 1-dehydrogenase-like Zn-dependent alcohol dehydrogenase